jgi:hypothetical protein
MGRGQPRIGRCLARAVEPGDIAKFGDYAGRRSGPDARNRLQQLALAVQLPALLDMLAEAKAITVISDLQYRLDLVPVRVGQIRGIGSVHRSESVL